VAPKPGGKESARSWTRSSNSARKKAVTPPKPASDTLKGGVEVSARNRRSRVFRRDQPSAARTSFRTRAKVQKEAGSLATAFLPPTSPVRRLSSCKRTPTREYIPLRSRQTYICFRSADFIIVLGLSFVWSRRIILIRKSTLSGSWIFQIRLSSLSAARSRRCF
jgi:hypothetical protein